MTIDKSSIKGRMSGSPRKPVQRVIATVVSTQTIVLENTVPLNKDAANQTVLNRARKELAMNPALLKVTHLELENLR